MYKIFDVSQAVPALTRAAEVHRSQRKWTMASKILEKLAELYEQLDDLDNMLKCLREAHRFLKQQKEKAGANRIEKKVAETLNFNINLCESNKNMKKSSIEQKLIHCSSMAQTIIR